MGIDTYLAVAFWMGIVAIAFRFLGLIFYSYPRTQEISVGQDMAGLLLSIAFFVWVCLLLYGGLA